MFFSYLTLLLSFLAFHVSPMCYKPTTYGHPPQHTHTHSHTRSEVTEGALQVWRTLPERIRQDPSLASFRQEHERLHGGKYSLLDKDLQEVEEQQPALLCCTTFVYLVSCLVAAYD